MVDAVEIEGAIRLTWAWLTCAQRLTPAFGALIVGFAVGVSNNRIDSLPLGLMAGGTIAAAHIQGLLTNSVLIGVDLGPNLSVTRSLATILWLLALRKEAQNVSFLKFLRIGLIAMPVALLPAIGGAIAMNALIGRR